MERKSFIDTFVSGKDGIYSLFGPAGSGKSTCIADICKELHCVVLTPTHAAKNRLKEDGVESATIHKFLKINSKTNLFAENMDAAEDPITTEKPRKVDIIIVDEFSMADKVLLNKLIGLSNKILLVGDPAQLPPVKAVAADIDRIKELSVASYTLTTIYRSSCDSIIGRSDQCRATGEVDVDVSVDELTSAFIKDVSDDKIYIAYTNKEVERVSNLLNVVPEEEMTIISHTGYSFWSREKEEWDKIFNGDLLTIECMLHVCPFIRGSHTRFNLPFPELLSDSNYYIATFYGIDVPFVHCYLGSKREYDKKYKAPVFKELQQLSMELHTEYSLTGTTAKDKSNALWEALSDNFLTSYDASTLRKAYGNYKAIDNVMVGNDARVSTVHKAQGRGFDTVYANITGMDKKQKYVALTRAKKTLVVGA